MSDIQQPGTPEASAPEAPASPTGQTQLQETPAPPIVDHLPPFRVLLHNDDHNDMLYVVETLCDLTPLNPHRATNVMMEAHTTGVALVLVTHRERAELYIEQFRSKRLTATMEPV
jgi:ATP-dependent Clp protease adaptor protein ClpS